MYTYMYGQSKGILAYPAPLCPMAKCRGGITHPAHTTKENIQLYPTTVLPRTVLPRTVLPRGAGAGVTRAKLINGNFGELEDPKIENVEAQI